MQKQFFRRFIPCSHIFHQGLQGFQQPSFIFSIEFLQLPYGTFYEASKIGRISCFHQCLFQTHILNVHHCPSDIWHPADGNGVSRFFIKGGNLYVLYLVRRPH